MKQKIVLVQGAFEIIHYGHIRVFQRAKSLGDILIVALNVNRLLPEYKKREAIIPWWQKATIIRNLGMVDMVVQAHNFSPLSLLKKYDVDVYCCGSEWVATKAEEFRYMREKGGKVVILPRYARIIPTSEIKRRLLAEAQKK